MPQRRCGPTWLDTYLSYTRFQQAPTLFHTWVGLSTLASALRRNVHIFRGFYKLFPNLYVAIVGPTGVTKTTAADIGVGLMLTSVNLGTSVLQQIPDITVIQGKATSWYLLHWFGGVSQSGKDCCCTIYSGEMKDLLSDLNKTELVALLTSIFTCQDTYDHHTKSGGQLTLKNICINLLACSTPEWLVTGTTVDEIAGGFTGRFVYVYSDADERSVAFPEDFVTPDVLALKDDLVHDLYHISRIKGKFVITPQAKAEYIIWYNGRKSEWKDERLVGYYARKGDLVLKLSMLLSVSESDALVIDENILHTAWKLLTQVEEHMVDAFSGIVDDPALKYKDSVLSQIARAPGQTISRADLLRKNWNKFDGVILDRIIANLTDARIIKCENKTGQIWYTLVDVGFV